MKKKIIIFLIVLLFSVGFAYGDDNTTDMISSQDNGNYISVVSIIEDAIKFDDGFEGFCLDFSKDAIAAGDEFELGEFTGSADENNVKLAIIECYRHDKSSEIGKVISEMSNGNSDDEIVKNVLNSNEKIADSAVADIDNNTKATFTFELLKSASSEKSDVIAYKVSFEHVDNTDVLKSSDTNDETPALVKDSADSSPNSADTSKDKTSESVKNTDSDKNKNSEKVKNTDSDKNKSSESKDIKNTSADETSQNQNSTPETVNKTVTITKNTTTTITKNVKTANKTDPTTENDTNSTLLKVAGNPVFILIIVIIIIAVIIVVINRKD